MSFSSDQSDAHRPGDDAPSTSDRSRGVGSGAAAGGAMHAAVSELDACVAQLRVATRAVPLFVPARITGTLLASVAPRSAIAAEPEDLRGARRTDPSLRAIWYEGFIHHGSSATTYADRAVHAAWRALSRYPTSAWGMVPDDALIPVGHIDLRDHQVTVTNTAALAAWLEMPTLDERECVAADMRSAERTLWSAAATNPVAPHLHHEARRRLARLDEAWEETLVRVARQRLGALGVRVEDPRQAGGPHGPITSGSRGRPTR